MRVLAAPDSFKGSLSAAAAASAISRGVLRAHPNWQVKELPIADGGEGTLETLVAATNGQMFTARVRGPLGKVHDAQFGVLGQAPVAVIEMAQASGLTLVPPNQRNPMLTSSFGTGQLIVSALDLGYREIIITLGGSATVDGGLGMLAALGARFFDAAGRQLEPLGGSLNSLAAIDLLHFDRRLRDCRIKIASDVTNPLLGPEGAAPIFGPQKGATPAMVETLAAGLARFAELTKDKLGLSVADLPGGGAAGGLGAAIIAYANGEMQAGIEVVLDALAVDRLLPEIDLVITGEGRLDGQTAKGKAPVGLARRARQYGCRTLALAGSLGAGYEEVFEHGIDGAFSIISEPMTMDKALQNAAGLLEAAAFRLAWLLGRQ